MDVITEGVETEQQLLALTEMGCNHFQGYFFSRPIPVGEFEMTGQTDLEMYRAFDICYDYDGYPVFRDYLRGRKDLQTYAETINSQESVYPDNYVKLRFLENHDQPRAGYWFPDRQNLIHATAFLFFLKGMTLLYAGQEMGISALPDLFEKDPVCWDGPEGADLSGLITRLSALKKNPLFAEGRFRITAIADDFLVAGYRRDQDFITGVFSLKGAEGEAELKEIPDGTYVNEIDGSKVEVFCGKVKVSDKPLIFYVRQKS